MADTYDYIVIGGGSAGSIVAARLTAVGATVLLLEAGGTDRRPDVIIPAGVVAAYKLCNWDYEPDPDPSRNDVVEPWPAGKVLGGSGSINGTVFVRGNRADFDDWAKAGCDGWDYDTVLPHFRRLETWEDGEDDYRGGSGPISVVRHTMPHPATDLFTQAAVQDGHQLLDDYNGAEQLGVGHVQVNQRRGTRSQSSREYLRHVADRSRLTVRTKATVHRITTMNRRATGVEYRRRGSLHVAHATKEVVLCAGALASPKVLMLSGIGPRAQLEAHGIEVVHDSPAVGENLRDHIGLVQRWHTTLPTINEMGPTLAARSLWDYARHRTGNLTATVFQVQVMLKTSPELDRPNVQLAFASFGVDRRGPDGTLKVQPSKHRSLMVSSTFLHPRTVSRLRLRSADPDASLRIEQAMLADPDDVHDVIQGAQAARRVMARPAIAAVVGDLFDEERKTSSDADWEAYLRANATYGVHSGGTCKMGVDAEAVVDPELRVVGITGLRVVDASIMPTTITGNTNAAVMMIGERGAELLHAG